MIARVESQRGVALIMALLVVALVAALASTLVARQDLWLRQLETQRDLDQARRFVSAGIDWARAVLVEDARVSDIDHAGEPWATRLPALPAEGGQISGELVDEQARWNLNNIFRGGRVSETDMAVFRRLLTLLQLPPGLAASLADWLDSDDRPDPAGAEDEYYLRLDPPYRAANRALSDVDGLLRVKGFGREEVERLRPHVTALPEPAPVNLNTADATVLSAVLGTLSPADIRRIIDERDRAPFRDAADLAARLRDPELRNAPGLNLLDKRSRYFRVIIHARYGKAEVSASALLDRHSPSPTLIWQDFE